MTALHHPAPPHMSNDTSAHTAAVGQDDTNAHTAAVGQG